MKNTHYQILGVNQNASKKELLQALKLRIKCVQRMFEEDPILIQINTDFLLDCYNTLVNPETKIQYDYELLFRKCSILEQKETEDYIKRLHAYIVMKNPAQFVIRSEDNRPILTGYRIPEEDQRMLKVKTESFYHIIY